MSGIQMLDGERIIAELAPPDDYARHLDQVVCVTDQRIIFLKKKVGFSLPYVVECRPVSQCHEIGYSETTAVLPALGGAFLVLLGLVTLPISLFVLFTKPFDNQVKSLLAVALAALPLMISGWALVTGIKRQHLLFRCHDRRLSWTSSAGSLRHWLPSLTAIKDFARSAGIATNGFPGV